MLDRAFLILPTIGVGLLVSFYPAAAQHEECESCWYSGPTARCDECEPPHHDHGWTDCVTDPLKIFCIGDDECDCEPPPKDEDRLAASVGPDGSVFGQAVARSFSWSMPTPNAPEPLVSRQKKGCGGVILGRVFVAEDEAAIKAKTKKIQI